MLQSHFQLSPIKAMELAASRIPGVISLAQGIPSFSTPAIIRDFVREKIAEGLCDRYSLTIGLAELREEIALNLAAEGMPYDAETEIVVTCGSIEAISAAVLSCSEPGDEIVIPSPTYASYLGALAMGRITPRYAALDEDRNFDFQVENIRKAITNSTRAILYCSPNNPTGTLYSEQKTRELAELALRHNLLLIIDEVYKDFYYVADKHFSPVLIPEMRNHVIRICSFSKSYAMTGWRVGFVHSAQKNIENLLKYHDAMVTCAPVVSQYAAIAALRFGQDYLLQFKTEFQRRRDYCIQRLDQLSHVLDYQLPKATYFVFPRIKDTVPLSSDSNKLAYDILQRAKLALVPGIAFGPTGESHLRISYGREMSDLEQGLDRLANYFHSSSSAARLRKSENTESLPLGAGLVRAALNYVLRVGARLFLKRVKPTIVGIAGTKGKTVFKRIIQEVLSTKLSTRSGILSYNTEIGLPLSILGLKAPKTAREKLRFLLAFPFAALFKRKQEEVLVLEYGIRSADDARALSKICVPNWLVLSGVQGSDPSIDYPLMQKALTEFVSQVPPEKVFWDSQDEIANSICVNSPVSNRLVSCKENGDQPNGVSESIRLADNAARTLLERISVQKNAVS